MILLNALITSTLQGLVLALIVALCFQLFPRIPAAARSFIWTAVFALILALPFLPAAHTSSHSIALNPLWSIALAALWLTASLIRATQLLLSALALRRLARTATPVSFHGDYTLCTSPDVDRPSVVGFFSRRILLPPALYASLTPAELHHVLLHETEHLRRRDDWTNLLQKIALVLVPLNPVLFWVERRLCLERELACDDRVLRATGTPKAYATCLTHLAQHSLLRHSLTLALGFFERQSELTRRVHRILLASQQPMSHRQTLAATGAVLLTLAGGTLQLTHAPQLIHFATPAVQSAQLTSPGPMAVGTATFRTASFRTASFQEPAAKPALLKTAMPAPHTTVKPHSSRVRRTTPQPRKNTFRALRADFSMDESTTPPHLIFTAVPTTQTSYTLVPAVAVATSRGWIIFQL